MLIKKTDHSPECHTSAYRSQYSGTQVLLPAEQTSVRAAQLRRAGPDDPTAWAPATWMIAGWTTCMEVPTQLQHGSHPLLQPSGD